MPVIRKPVTSRTLRRARHPASMPSRMRGVSLIEVLVSVVILGIGLMGVAAMQSVALRGGQSSLETSQAVMQTNAIAEAMRANRVNALSYNTVGAGFLCAAGTGSTLAQNDLRDWLVNLKTNITKNPLDATTCGRISGCPTNCEISVRWDDQRAGGSGTRTITTRTRI